MSRRRPLRLVVARRVWPCSTALGGRRALASAGWKGAPLLPKLDGPYPGGDAVATLRRGSTLWKSRRRVFAKVGRLAEPAAATFAQAAGLRPLDSRVATAGLTRDCSAVRGAPAAGHEQRTAAAVNSFSRRQRGSDQPGPDLVSGRSSAGASPDPNCGASGDPIWPARSGCTRPGLCRDPASGSNDVALALALGGDPLPGFIANMQSDDRGGSRAHGVVPLLTTIPPRVRRPDGGGRRSRGSTPALHRLASAPQRAPAQPVAGAVRRCPTPTA